MDIAIHAGLGQEALTTAKMQDKNKENSDFAARLERAGKGLQQGNANEQDKTKLRAACKDMEAVFLNLMMQQMRATVQKSGLLGDSQQEDIMQSMLDSEMTKNLAQAGGVGLADMLYKQLSMPSTGVTPPKKG